MSTDFLDRLASQLRANKSAACRRAIQRILAVVKKNLEDGKYKNDVEAEAARANWTSSSQRLYSPRFAFNAPPAPPRQKLQGDAVLSGQNPSRRFTSRVAGPPDLWVFWNCKKHDGLSRVLDLSVGGLCLLIGKSERMAVGEKVHLNFLAPEGQIRTDAVVRNVRPERLGLKFIAISEEDRAHLTALMTRLRNLSRLP